VIASGALIFDNVTYGMRWIQLDAGAVCEAVAELAFERGEKAFAYSLKFEPVCTSWNGARLVSRPANKFSLLSHFGQASARENRHAM
jgi:hypothetical protein